jgi:DNA-binding transcriptional ArsR family regulator
MTGPGTDSGSDVPAAAGRDDLDPVWKALANPIRRRMLDLLRAGARTTSELADSFTDLSRFAVMQHLRVLVDAELVVPRRSGRRRFNHLNPVPIQRIHDRWVSRYRRHWAEALVDLKAALEANAADGEATPAALRRSSQ